MQYESKTESSEQTYNYSEVAAALEQFLEGDNKALARMLKEADITRTDVQQS
ncbi:MAG: hypothetical protein IKF07_03635 [Eubacterium sp.]|nr:hypothetical protein [Eubacterium sp.]